MESVNPSEDIRPILLMLEEQGIEIISVENGFVRCPGKDYHTTQTADSHCRVYNNSGVPRLHCFHQSCKDLVETANAVFQKRYGGSLTAIAQETVATVVSQSSDESECRLLESTAWPYDAICNDPHGLVTHPPEMHYQLLLTLFEPDDIVWVGRDLYDTGSEGHVWRFRTSDHWLVQPECPGTFICPSTFKAGCHSRSDANVLQRKFLVVESDFLDKNQIGAVFRRLEGQGLTLRAVVDTAGKSLHGWFDMPDPGGLSTLKKELTLLKCDPSMFKPSQPCRLPGASRDGAHQKLIYFKQ